MRVKRSYLALATGSACPTRVGIQRGMAAGAVVLSLFPLACTAESTHTPPIEEIVDGATVTDSSVSATSSSASTSSGTTSTSFSSASTSATTASASSVSGTTSATTGFGTATGFTTGGMSTTAGPGPNGAGGAGGATSVSTGGPTGTGGGNSETSTSGTTGGPGGGETRSAGCDTPRQLMNGRRSIQSGGQNRDYILRVPDDYDNTKPYRLIMAYHWLGGNAQQVAEGGNGGSTEDPYYGLWDLAQGSTIFVAPEGLDAGWANSGDRDINLTDAILEEVQNDLCIDTSRIFATGFSYGAGMSYALACARAEVFRGVALYAGAQLSGCSGGTTPIAYFHAHGVRDSVLRIEQGRPLRDRFVEVNGCTPQNPPEPPENSGTHICTSYEGCTDGYPVRWCAHGGDHNPTEKDNGQSKSWVPGEAWDFISQF